MTTDSIRLTSSGGRQSQRVSDGRATMAGETELTLDIYGSGSLLSPSPRDEAPAIVSSAAAGHDNTRTTNGAALTGNGSARRKNGFLPSGMSHGSDRSDRNGKKQQPRKRITPVWRRFTAKQGQEVVNEPHSDRYTTANGVNTSYNFMQFPTATDNNRMASAGDSQNRAGLTRQAVVDVSDVADVRRSSLVEKRSDSGQQHLYVILGAPSGFRDSSFDESDEASRTAADGSLLSPRISMNADGSFSPASQGFFSSSTDVKKRPAPPLPPVQPTLPPPPLIVKDFNSRKRQAPEVPSSSRAEQYTTTTSADKIQSSVNDRHMEVGDKPAADVGKVVIPKVFRQSKSSASNFRSSARSASSIFRRSSFLRHLESVVGRNTPTSSSAVSTMTRGAERNAGAEDGMHNSSAPGGELHQSTDSLVSRLFHSALHDHDDGSGGRKKFKFLVPGIDVPAETAEQQSADVNDDGTMSPSSRVRRGFSYLKDVEVAAEVTRRAVSVTARRPHESVEVAKTMRDRVDNYDGTDDDEATLKAARARLHAPQTRSDFPDATMPPSASGSRKQMLLDIVDAARRRARKTGIDAADDSYLQEEASGAKNQNYSDQRIHNPLRGGFDASEKRRHQFIPREVKESKDEISRDNRQEVPRGVSQTSAVFESGQTAVERELKASDYHRVPAAPKFSSADVARQAETVTSYRAARHAHRDDIDRQLNAGDRLAADDAVSAASVRHHRYLSYMSDAPVASRRADAGFETCNSASLDDLQPRHRPSSSSSNDDLDSWWVDDDEEGDGGGYTVSIVGGQVSARRWDDRFHQQRSSAPRYHRHRSSLRRRPHVRERPVSVEVWSSGDEGDSRWIDDPPRRRRFTADRPPSPLTVNTGNFTARPHTVIGHIHNAGVRQSTEVAHPRMTGAESNRETFHYFSDPETKFGPYRTGAYVSQSDVYSNSPPSLNFVTPEVDTFRSGRQAFSTVPLNTTSQPFHQRPVEAVTAVDPYLADVGTKNSRYFVEMKLNAARGRRVGCGSSSNSGGSNGGELAARSWFGSAPQLLQLTDDVTDRYAGARYNSAGGTWFSAMQPNVRHATVYDVTAPAGHGASLLARRPQSTLSWTNGGATATTGHVLRSVASSRSPPAAVMVAADNRRRPVKAVNGDINRSTVEFDIELEPTRHAEMDEGRRSTLLSSVHANGLAGHRPSTPPAYSIQLNDTMRIDIDGTADQLPRRQPAPSSPTRDHVRPQRQPRRRRPPEQEDDVATSRQKTVVDPEPPPRPSRRRRQIPVVYEDSRPSRNSDHVGNDVEVFGDDEVFGVVNHNAETYRSVITTGADRTRAGDDLPRVVRGSILIRNSIDTTGLPRHIDVVTGDSDAESDVAFVAEDNTNMFHGRYRQSRENPIYLSDPEQSPDEVDKGPTVNSRTYVSTRSRQNRRQDRRANNATSIVDDFDKNVKISRGYGLSSRRQRTDTEAVDLVNGQYTSSSATTRQDGKDVKGVRQKFDVHREDDEIIGPLQKQGAAADDPASMVNVDVVSEKIDVALDDGVARVTLRVRCERIVPIRGSSDLYKKSAVVVTRVIGIDLTVTEERRRLYQRALERTVGRQAQDGGTLATEDTFALYKALMGLADRGQTASRERLHIERLLDEQRTSAVDLVDVDEVLAAPAARPVPRHPPPTPPPRPSTTTQHRSTATVQNSTSETVRRQQTGFDSTSDTATSMMY